MKGFVLGVLVAGLAFGGYLFWNGRRQHETAAPTTVAAGAAPAKKKARRPRAAVRIARSASSGPRPAGAPAPEAEPQPRPEPEPMRLSAADLRTVGLGDNLSRPEVVRMDMAERAPAQDLSQDDIDERFRAEETAIVECIARARPDEETYVPGRVTVKFRIQRTGAVGGVRVEGPAILQKNGLFECTRNVIKRLRFPASGSSQIVEYPFALS